MMTKTIRFKDVDGSEYRLSLSPDEISIDCWFPSSVASGSDTECGHTITGTEALNKFLEATEHKTLNLLAAKSKTFDKDQWSLLHKQVQDHQTSRNIWD